MPHRLRWGINAYDASGMRQSQSTVAPNGTPEGTVTAATSYLWNGDRLLEERDKDGALLAGYEHGQELGPLRQVRSVTAPGSPAGTAPTLQTRLFIGDGQDSTRQLTDTSGALTDSYFYDAFGVPLAGGQSTSPNSFLYTGQQADPSGLYYLRARYYDAGTGRFLSHDPVMGSSDPVTFHRYLYAGGDPANAVDPSGREFTLFGISNTIMVNAILGGVGNGVIGLANGHTGGQLAGDVALGAGLGAISGADPALGRGLFVLSALQAVKNTIDITSSKQASGADKIKAWANLSVIIGAAPGALGRGMVDIAKTQETMSDLIEDGRGVSSGELVRSSVFNEITPEQQMEISQTFEAVGGDPSILRFNEGGKTGYSDANRVVNIRGDVYPNSSGNTTTATMNLKLTLAHELGHVKTAETSPYEPNSWQDEYLAAKWAVKNVANLSVEERSTLLVGQLIRR